MTHTPPLAAVRRTFPLSGGFPRSPHDFSLGAGRAATRGGEVGARSCLVRNRSIGKRPENRRAQ